MSEFSSGDLKEIAGDASRRLGGVHIQYQLKRVDGKLLATVDCVDVPSGNQETVREQLSQILNDRIGAYYDGVRYKINFIKDATTASGAV